MALTVLEGGPTLGLGQEQTPVLHAGRLCGKELPEPRGGPDATAGATKHKPEGWAWRCPWGLRRTLDHTQLFRVSSGLAFSGLSYQKLLKKNRRVLMVT